MSAKLVSRKESKEARQRATKILKEVRKHNKIKGHYKFNVRPIGSGNRRCIVKDSKGKYDLDYQMILTSNSKNGDGNPTQIKSDFFQAFTDSANDNEKVENSTTVITVRASKSSDKFVSNNEKFSFDFVILSIDEKKRIRRNGIDQFTWVELPSKNSEIYNKFNNMSSKDKRKLLEDMVIPRIIEEKNKDESIRKPSIHIFFVEVSNYKESV